MGTLRGVPSVPVGVFEMGRLPFALALLGLLFASTACGAPSTEAVVSKPSLVCPQTKMGNEGLQDQYEKTWKQFIEDVDLATRSLENEITTRFTEAKNAGHLDLALMWDGMRKEFTQMSEVRWDSEKEKRTWNQRFDEADFPDDLLALLKKGDQDFKTARERLEEGYRNIESALTKADDLPQAVKVRAELKAVLAGEPAPQPVPPNEPESVVLVAPRSLVPYRDKVGKTFSFRVTASTKFRVTASTKGYLWGGADNVYTDDSSLAKAVVHAGVLPLGAEGIVTVKIAPGQNAYAGSTRNGISSRGWGQHGGSYRIVAGKITKPNTMPINPTKPLLERMTGKWSSPNSNFIRVVQANGAFLEEVKPDGRRHATGRIMPRNDEVAIATLDNGWVLELRLSVDGQVVACLVRNPQGQEHGDGEVMRRLP